MGWPPLKKSFMSLPSVVAKLIWPELWQSKALLLLSVSEEGSLSFFFFWCLCHVLIQVNCLLCIINFLLSPSLFLSPTFNSFFKGPLPRFHPPRCLLKVTAARVWETLFEAGTKKATPTRRFGVRNLTLSEKCGCKLKIMQSPFVFWRTEFNLSFCLKCWLLFVGRD